MLKNRQTSVQGVFAAGDITTTGGTLSAFSGSGTSYTATFTPTPNINNLTGEISVAANSYTDTAGNNGLASSPFSISGDTQAPSLTISSTKNDFKVGETATVSFTFTEEPSGFDTNDVSISGGAGSIGAITGTGLVRTALFTPTTNTNPLTGNLSVVANSYTDAAGNLGNANNSIPLTGDTWLYESIDGQGSFGGLTISLDASTIKHYTDSFATGNNVVISNFGSDDSITFTTGANSVIFEDNGTDITLTMNAGGTVSTLILLGISQDANGKTVFDLASFNSLAVGDVSII